jgi:hypothetical protein
MLSRCVLLLGSSSSHASTAAIAFHAICPAVSTHARMVTTAIVSGCTLDTAIAADHSVIAVLAAIRTTISPLAAVSVRRSIRMLNATVAAN